LLAKAINSRDLLSRLPSAAQRRVRDLVEVRPDKAVMLDDTRARLVEYFRPYNDELALWLGRDLSAWNR
jgi:hypothetical protein